MQNTPSPPPLDAQTQKRQILWLMLALFFVIGWFSVIVSEKSSYFPLFQIVCSLFSTIFILRWVALDAAQRHFKLTPLWGILFVLFAMLAMPVYLIRTRGKAAWRPLVTALGLLLAYGVALAIGQLIAKAVGF